MKKIITQAILVSAISGAEVDTKVAKIMEHFNLDDIEAKIKADLI